MALAARQWVSSTEYAGSFVAVALLYLNNRVRWASSVPRNSLATNALLAVILLLFLVVGGKEVIDRL